MIYNIQINENQELLNDWTDKKRDHFYFYGRKFDIKVRDEENGSFLVCMKGKELLIVRQFDSVWMIAYGVRKKKGDKKDKDEDDERTLKSAADAWIKIKEYIFDPIEEAGIQLIYSIQIDSTR